MAKKADFAMPNDKHAAERKLLPIERAEELAGTVPDWTFMDQSIAREFRFASFRDAMAFVNRVAELAEEQDHHPDICVFYNRVHLELSTHKVGGLTEEDFELARKIDGIA